MQGIINFLTGIGNAIITAFDLIFAFVADLITLVKLISTVPFHVMGLVTWMPAEMIGFFGLFATIIVLYKVLGRD